MGIISEKSMFYQLGEYRFARTRRQAMGFYIAYMLLGALFVSSAVGVFADIPAIDPAALEQMTLQEAMTNEAFQGAVRISKIVLILYVGLLSFLVLAAKGLGGNQRALYAAAGGVGLTALTNILFGLIPLAYLTTLEPQAKTVDDGDADEEGE